MRPLFGQPANQSGILPNRFLQLVNQYDQLSSLANYEIFALQACQMLGGAWPRRSDQAGDILVDEGHPKQGAPRFLHSEIGTYFEQGSRDAVAKSEIHKPRPAY